MQSGIPVLFTQYTVQETSFASEHNYKSAFVVNFLYGG